MNFDCFRCCFIFVKYKIYILALSELLIPGDFEYWKLNREPVGWFLSFFVTFEASGIER